MRDQGFLFNVFLRSLIMKNRTLCTDVAPDAYGNFSFLPDVNKARFTFLLRFPG